MNDLTALRDRLAGLCGWQRQTGCWSEWESDKSYVVFNERWVRGSERTYFDPFKPGDLTALFAAIPSTANYSLSRTAEGVYELRSGWPVPYEGVGSSVEAVLLEWLVAVLDTSYKMS